MTIKYLLFPGRHHIVTKFQVDYLKKLRKKYPGSEVIWAITSADHVGTQRNPIIGHRRLGMIESVLERQQMPGKTYLIPNRQAKADFVHYLIEEIRSQTGGDIDLAPENTVVACSTPALIRSYRQSGFLVETVELDTDQPRPWDIIEKVIELGEDWRNQSSVTDLIDQTALQYFQRYAIDKQVIEIYNDPLISSDDGDITETRDYETYRQAFEENAWRKVQEFAEFVQPGKIVDIGCATGQTVKLLAQRPELFESDFYGVEAARPLYNICQQRLANGEFGDANVFFHQRNIMTSRLLKNASMQTVITMALTHEVYSYLGRGELTDFIARVYQMLAPGGVYINYDVVGPDEPDELVYVELSRDGEDLADNEPLMKATAEQLRNMSARSRFIQFCHDFRREEGSVNRYEWQVINGKEYAVLTRRLLYEYLAKKDYLDSWYSEMHEEFCFYSYDDWREVLARAGFEIADGTKPIRNQWLIDNRFSSAAQVYRKDAEGELIADDWSWTNVMIVARRPEQK